MNDKYLSFGLNHFITTLRHNNGYPFLEQICGFKCAVNGKDEGPQGTRGWFVVDTLSDHFEINEFRVVNQRFFENEFETGFFNENSGLEFTTKWTWDGSTKIWSRRDRIKNLGTTRQVLTRCLARFTFSPSQYACYTQSGSWSHENQGHFNSFEDARLCLYSQGGRTIQGGSPYLFVTDKDKATGIAFHLIPCGDWTIQVDQTRNINNPHEPFLVLEMGLSDKFLRYSLEPGQSFTLPEILIQAVEGSTPETGAAALQEYVLEKFLSTELRQQSKIKPPVVYNTWFDAFECLDVLRLHRQLEAAKIAGCEIFTVDAGWFGAEEGSWHQQVGDWREKMDGAFKGQMKSFAEEVRAAGLGFGLWMEPERYSRSAPVVRSHPQWFLAGDAGFMYPDLQQPDAFDYVSNEISQLVETYHLAWMKVDFNFELGLSFDGLSGYYQGWYKLLDDIKVKHPDLFIEGCASGGMRSDINTISHFDAHFLSDTVNPFDTLRISQGAALRLPLGRITKWAVLRSAHRDVVRYGLPVEDAPERVFTPAGGDWENAFVADLDFCYLATLPGIPGLSGDLASLSKSQLARIAQINAFYKDWRSFISNSICNLITPIRPQEDTSGWIVFHVYQEKENHSLLFVYRLNDGSAVNTFHLDSIDRSRSYYIHNPLDVTAFDKYLTGSELLDRGLTIEILEKNAAKVLVIEEVKTTNGESEL